MKIGMLMLRHSQTLKSPMMPEVIRLLTEWGATVEIIYPEEQITNLAHLTVQHDLYVLKSESELALSMAGALHAAGANILNPYQVAVMMRDKIVATKVVQSAGVPVPETHISLSPRQFAPLLDPDPLIVKPCRGTQGRGVRVVWDSDELDNISASDGPVFAQRYHKPEGEDRKIYCIGGQLFGVLRNWPAKSYQDKLGRPFTITPELRDIALRCARAFGIDLFGLDVIISDGQPYVVDIQSFPGFKGVPDAALRLADYIYTVAQRVMAGGPVSQPILEEEVAA